MTEMSKNFLLFSAEGQPKAMLVSRSMDKIVADGYGEWTVLPMGQTAYVMQAPRSLTSLTITIFLFPGDYIVEDTL